MLLERYREFLPITNRTPMLTLNEGNTPLVADEIGPAFHDPRPEGAVKSCSAGSSSLPTGTRKKA